MTSITKIGGVVVVTQVIPRDESSMPLHTAATASQAPPPTTQVPPPTTQPPPHTPAKVDDMTATFLRGEPQCLGIVQIFIGLLCILFSLTAVYSPILILHAPLCLAVTFVISGCLSVVAVRRTSVCRVWACLLWNVISVLLGLVGVAYLCCLLADRPPSERFCDTEEFVPTDRFKSECISRMWVLNASVYGPLGLLLVLLVLQVCVAVTVSVFSGKAIRRRDRYTPIVVEADDDNARLLRSDGEETSTSPPNSP